MSGNSIFASAFDMKSTPVRFILLLLFLLTSAFSQGQAISEEDLFISKLKLTQTPPAELLASRSAVLFSSQYTQKELEEIQKGFQQIGIDAVSYVESERALAGPDLMTAYSRYFLKRSIKFLIFMKRDKQEYQFYFVSFNGTSHWTDPDPSAWFVHALRLGGVLQTIYRSVISSQKRQNLLVNDYPERSGPLSAISGSARRDENLAPNVRVLKLAVQKTGDAPADAELQAYLKENFQVKYEIVEPNVEEKDLLQGGFIYVLRFIHAPGSLAKEILGYDMNKAESAFMTASYPGGTLQLKTIPSENTIYKFYIKHIEDNIFYLGLKWDADLTWQDALKNHVDGYRAAGRLN